MTRTAWIILAIVGVAATVALIVILNPHESQTIRKAAGELTHKQATKIEARRDQEIKAGDVLRKQSEDSTTVAKVQIEAAKEAGRKATIIRIQTHKPKSHAPVLPIADTTIARLQREFATFGD